MEVLSGIFSVIFFGITVLLEGIKDGHPFFGLVICIIYYWFWFILITPLINALKPREYE